MTKTAIPASTDVDVIAALRIAVEATDDWEKLGQVCAAILKTAPETPADNKGGLALLLDMHRSSVLRFDLTDVDADA